MNWFNSVSIRYKILTIVVLAVLGFTVSLVYNYQVTSANNARLDNVSDVYFPTLKRTAANVVLLDKVKEALNAAGSSEEMDFVDDADELVKKMYSQFDEIIAIDSTVKEGVENLKDLLKKYYATARDLTVKMVEENLDAKQAAVEAKTMQQQLKRLSHTLNAFRSASYDRFVSSLEETKKASSRALQVGLIISVVVAIVVALVGYFISTVVVSNISRVTRSLRDMEKGEGDLSQRIDITGNDELGELVAAFNGFVEKLQGIIGHIMGSTAQLASAAEEMAAVSESSTRSSAQQQSEVSQVATAMNEMAATVQEVSRNAAHAADAAQDASSQANDGLKVVDLTISSINSLADAVGQASEVINQLENDTGNIGVVLEVIRGISEQTNLLALNAAIEAARAGEQGRGFAVVADEVRTLASRTQESTLEIQNMIEKLQSGASQAVEVMETGREQADKSVGHARQAGESLGGITQAVVSISDMNAQIATASEEQTAVAEEINQNIVNISQLGEDAVSSAQQTSAASEELARLSSELQGLVGQFKV